MIAGLGSWVSGLSGKESLLTVFFTSYEGVNQQNGSANERGKLRLNNDVLSGPNPACSELTHSALILGCSDLLLRARNNLMRRRLAERFHYLVNE